MKRSFIVGLALILVLAGGSLVLADEGHKKEHVPSTSNLKGNEHSEHNMEGMDMNKSDHDMKDMDMGDSHDMKDMDMSDSHNMKDMDMSGHKDNKDDMEGMDMEGESSHSHGPVKEKPANIKVLGTFGAVNLSFIVFGVWHKWFRRKERFNGNSK